jgi:predicted Zn-dependent peptidase
MKKLLILLFVCMTAIGAMAQQKDIKHATFTLSNGMKVVLAEDHSQPKIFGAVIVHVGSKNDFADATGGAHYFEHIMFKGTDSIGTINWPAEKVYLDSISMMYDSLHKTQDQTQRLAIQREINRLTIASSQYAIPNEVDLILGRMGGTGLNASTSYDVTEYHNIFPSNQLAKWMDVYVERFRKPIFRLFQSELEAVYEEKNMYEDQTGTAFLQKMMVELFGEHPYSRPIVGTTEHLKNPQMSRMRQFYDTYYVANNMTLLLVGDLDINQARALAEQKFGKMRSGTLPARPTYQLPQYKGHEADECKLTPIKMGVITWRGKKQSDEDVLLLSLLSSVVNNESGPLAKLTLDRKLMAAQFLNITLEDAGSYAVLYIPKLVGQKHQAAEQLVFAALDSIKQGRFSDDLFEAAKMQMLRDREEELEDFNGTVGVFLSLETTGHTYEEYLKEIARLKSLTKQDVVNMARAIFTDNYRCVRSGMGFPKKDHIQKPDWKPIEAQNTESRSAFASKIDAEAVSPVSPQVVDMNKDVQIMEVTPGVKMYAGKNPVNNIFNLSVVYNYGTLKDADLDRAVSYYETLGTTLKDYQAFSIALNKLGAHCDITTAGDETTLNISGFEENMEAILSLVQEKMLHAKADPRQKENIVEGVKAEEKAFKDDVSSWLGAVEEYAMYGDSSQYLLRAPIKQWQKRSDSSLIAEVNEAFRYDGHVLYTGNSDPQVVAQLLLQKGIISNHPLKGVKQIRQPKNYATPQVFVATNKRFSQSNISFRVQSDLLTKPQESMMQLFNKYYGFDMYSVVFQEIREFRSLGYTAYGYLSQDDLHHRPAALYGYLGTQSDKTIDGITAMEDIMRNLPRREDKFSTAKEALVLSRNSSYIDFRSLPATVQGWQELGYDSDPRAVSTATINAATSQDMLDFYHQHIQGRPIVVRIAGNGKSFSSKQLAQFGEVHVLKMKDIIHF